MSARLIWPLIAGVITAVVLVYWRGFFWQHAAMIGIAIMALVYSGAGTIRRLRGLYEESRQRGEPD